MKQISLGHLFLICIPNWIKKWGGDMFEDLKENINQEKKILADMNSILVVMSGDTDNYNFYLSSLNSLAEQIRMLNRAVPELLKEWSPIINPSDKKIKLKLPEIKKSIEHGQKKEIKYSNLPDIAIPKKIQNISEKKTVKMSYVSPLANEKRFVVINKDDRKDFLKKLQLSEGNLKKINKVKVLKSKNSVKNPSFFASFSNKLFRSRSDKLVSNFSSLASDLKKGNVGVLTSTYLSMAMLASIVALSVGFLIFIGLMFISVTNWVYGWIPFFLIGIVATAFYLYPANKAGTVQKNIYQELPFVAIHMAAIAGSEVEPTKIFKIIAESKEYPYIGVEVRKIIIQTEIYGYDLVTSLKNVASRTSNKKLAELFSGLATNITTGGELKSYLEKKADNFLMDYRLERQKYSDLAETFMDVYISILIAAPLVLMMMFIVMSVAGLSIGGLGLSTLLMLSIIAVVVINILFLFVLNIKQPKV